MQIRCQRLLSGAFALAILPADLPVFVIRNVVGLHARQPVLDTEPACREGITQVLETVGFTDDRLLQILEARAVLAVGLDEAAHDAELLHQSAAVQIEWMLLDLVKHDEDWRAIAKAV